MEGNKGWSVIEENRWRKGPWTSEEDKLLIEYVKLHGEGRWNSVSRLTGIHIFHLKF
jgi:myb proto-oncogene protein